MKKKITLALALFLCIPHFAFAQEWMKIHHRYEGAEWVMPLDKSQHSEYDFSDDKSTLQTHVVKNDGTEMIVPFSIEHIDSITFANSLTDSEKGHNKHRVFTMHIATDSQTPIVDKEEWVSCHISIDGKGEYSDYSGTGRIRGRGNSTWEWYDKKPYRFKLDSKSKLLGLEKAKNWNLLANYRDVTDMMNVFAFETARLMHLPFTNHSRFVEVFLNEEYIGVYQLTEKIEVGKNRVDIDENEGVILSFDADDGPEHSPYATNNFWSPVYKLPMSIKHPDDLTTEQMDAIIDDFAALERAVKTHDYAAVDSLMDIQSFISILQLHEYLYNVEIDAPRSLYMFKDKGGKYTFGPVWDWDAAYDFDWSDMLTGHTFFSDYRELLLGTDPVSNTGAAYTINMFWRNMFKSPEFVAQYKQSWESISDSILVVAWAETQQYIDQLTLSNAYTRESNKWPVSKTSYDWWGATSTPFVPANEIAKMSTWLQNRKRYIDQVVASYPMPDGSQTDFSVVSTITHQQPVTFRNNYHQTGQISVSESDILSALGGTPTSLVPLNTDGSEGSNTAAGNYGAWFNQNGDTAPWANGHVYIESNNLYSWSFGCHPDNCHSGDSHTVTMQYRRGKRAVNVSVALTVR